MVFSKFLDFDNVDSNLLRCDYPSGLVEDIKEIGDGDEEEKIEVIKRYIKNNTHCSNVGDFDRCELYVDDLIVYVANELDLDNEDYDDGDECFELKKRIDRVSLCYCPVDFDI